MESNNAVAIYVRVSSDQQVEGFSLEAQEAVLREDAKRRGKWVYQVYVDAGVSGAKTDRQGLGEMMADARKGRFGEVLVWKVSRVSRKLQHLLEFLEELNSLGIAFRSYSEKFDAGTGIGKFSLTMLGAVAQMQRESWKESSWIGMKKRFTSGRWNGGIPFGYRNVPDPDDPRGGTILETVSEEASIVRRIFQRYSEGDGYKKIVNELNSEGYRSRNGAMFSVPGIKVILENPVYIGKVRFAGEQVDGIHQPIIEQGLWDMVRERKRRRAPTTKMIDREYLLSGLLRCPECSGPMVPTHRKRFRKNGSHTINHYYCCANHLSKGKEACHANLVDADRIESEVLQKVMELLSNPYWTRQVVSSILQTRSTKGDSEDPEREGKLADLVRQKRDLLMQFENDKIALAEFKSEMQALKERESLLGPNATSNAIPKPEFKLVESQIRGALKSLRKVFGAATVQQKRKLLRSFVKQVILSNQRDLERIELLPMPLDWEASKEERQMG